MEGYIKLHRKMLENPIICKDGDTMAIWVYLLMNATYKPYDVLFKGKRITLQPGQLLTGIKSISSRLGISTSKVQRTLNLFESEKQLINNTSNKNRLITILNWDKYQASDNQMINNRYSSDNQLITNNNIKNIKEDKEDSVIVQKKFIEIVGSTNLTSLQECLSYLEDLKAEDIIRALEKSKGKTNRWNYAKAILNSWVKNGVEAEDNLDNLIDKVVSEVYSNETN